MSMDQRRQYDWPRIRRGSRNIESPRRRSRLETLEPRCLLVGEPFIAEFQAINNSTLQDEDGDFTDWIEIRNPRDEPVNLDGWHLTDNNDDLRKWRFPEVSIPASEEIIVFASNKDRANPVGELHTNFRLSGRGEYLALVEPDGITVSHAFTTEFPAQIADRSFGQAPGRNVTELITRGSPVKAHVPFSGELGETWTSPSFDDADWSTGLTAVGFQKPADDVVLVEGFDGPLGAEWVIDLPGESTSTVSIRDSKLAIAVPVNQGLGFGDEQRAAPFVHRDVPTDAVNYDFATHVETPTRGSAGLVVLEDANPNPVLALEFVRQRTIQFVDSQGNIISEVRVGTQQNAMLRLRRDGDAGLWTGYYKLQASDDWTVLGSINDNGGRIATLSNPRIGLQANTTTSELTAEFDDFKMTINAAPATYLSRIQHDLAASAYSTNSSVYLRMPFSISGDPSRFREMSMSVSIDDGFRAYLNGQPIASANIPDNLTWDSAALTKVPAVHREISASWFDLDSFLSILRPGENVLAVHAVNASKDDADLFFDVRLTASEHTILSDQFFATPSPGLPNKRAAVSAPKFVGEQGAFFESTVVQIQIDNVPASVSIHYTVDGTEPTIESPRYDGPFELQRTAMMQARAFDVSAHDAMDPSSAAAATFVAIDSELKDRSSDVPLVVLDTLGYAVPDTHSTTFVPVNVLFHRVDTEAGRSHLGRSIEYVGRGGIRERGSSSAREVKDSFAFELWGPNGTNPDDDFDASLADLPPESDWVLHAPTGFDRGSLRNQVLFEISRQVLPWAPRTQVVEVYLNRENDVVSEADYFGNYVLIEKIKQGEDRLDIADITPDDREPDSQAITGGYAWKIDAGDPGEPPLLVDGASLNWIYPKSPEGDARTNQKATLEQASWVRDYFNAFAATLESPDLNDEEGYKKYIDVISWVDNHLINVLVMNVDAFSRSAYLFKDRGEKIEYGPPWDCDRCMDSSDERDDDPLVWRTKKADFAGDRGTDFFHASWWGSLFKDSNFWQLYIDRWHELRASVWSDENLSRLIDLVAAPLAESQVRNDERWGPRARQASAYVSDQLDSTWQGEVEHLRHWLHARAGFMDANFVGQAQIGIDNEWISRDSSVFSVSPGTEIGIGGPPIPVFEDLVHITSGENPTESAYFVPSNDSLGTRWVAPAFNDSRWSTGPLGFGFASGDNFAGLINTVVNPNRIVPRSTTLLTRTSFDIDDLQAVQDQRLVLRVKYDDGIVVYLNGQRVADRNLRSDQLTWKSTARTNFTPDEFEDIELTDFKHLLVSGKNVLAIRTINQRASNNDMLLHPELVSRIERVGIQQTGTTYYTTDGTDPRGPDGTPAAAAIASGPDHRLVIEQDTRVIARTFDLTDRGPESTIVQSDWGPPRSVDFVVSRAGDFDGNAVVDAKDIDLLFEQLRNPNPEPSFDLNQDGNVDEFDRDFLVRDIMGTSFGDANLDGVFDALDLQLIRAPNEYEDQVPLNSSWAEGDFDGDGEFTSADIVLAFSWGGFVSK